MFDKEYTIKGRHAERVIALTENLDDDLKGGLHIFETNLDVYLNAPIIGFLYGRKEGYDNTKNPQTGELVTTKIFGDKMMKSQLQLIFNYRLVMLLDTASEPIVQNRINRAFRNMGEKAEDFETYESYVRGGIDVLYEKIIEGCESNHEIIEHLCEFLEDFHERFNSNIDPEKISVLCRVE